LLASPAAVQRAAVGLEQGGELARGAELGPLLHQGPGVLEQAAVGGSVRVVGREKPVGDGVDVPLSKAPLRLKGPDGKAIWVFDDNGNHVTDSKGKWVAATEKRAQFVLGYKGYVQLALRSGHYSDLDVMEIKAGEYLGKDPTTGKPRFQFIEEDDVLDEAPVIGYMAFFEYLNGFRKVLYWSKQKMMNHADMYSTAYSAAAHKKILDGEIPEQDMWKYSSFWYKNFDDMAKKTMLRQLISRWGVMSTELQQAFVQDTKFAAIGDGNEIITTPEEQLPLPIAQPEATTVVENVDLSNL